MLHRREMAIATAPAALVQTCETSAVPATQLVWLVAVSGSLSRSNAWEPDLLPPGNVPWVLWVVDAQTGETTGGGMTASPSNPQSWPAGWDEIHDLAR